MTSYYNTEHLIIGFGKAGKTFAKTLADAGKRVILVEKSAQMYGGTCINLGCIPSKKLKFLAHKNTPLAEAVAKKEVLTNTLNQANYNKLKDTVQIITGTASFVDPHSVQVVSAKGDIFIKADNIYINTGAINRTPDIVGIDSDEVYDSTTIMNLTQLPEHLLVIGGGYIGLEFAGIFAKFGSRVTVLETSDTFMPKEDRQIAEAVLATLNKQGIDIKLNQHIHKIYNKEGKTAILTDEGELMAQAVLAATGRMPNTHVLNLDKAGVKTDERGFIVVNEHLQTNIPHIFAMGDVSGTPQFTYMSLDDYRVVRSFVLADGSYTTKNRDFAYTVFVDPPLSVVGLTEETAKKQGHNVVTATLEATAIPNAKILENTDGLLKAVVDKDSGKILGVQLFCEKSEEMINFVALAITHNLHYQDIANHIFTHPSMSESLNDLFALID